MIGIQRFSFGPSARLFLAAAVGLAGATQAARGDLVAYESFSGQAGQTLAGMNGGSGFADAWHTGPFTGGDDSSSYVVQGSSLAGGTAATAGGRVASLAQYSLGSGLSRDLSTPLGTPGTTAYISILVRADGTLNEGAYGGFFGVTLNSSNAAPALFIGKTGSGSNYGIEDAGGTNTHLSTTAAAVGVTDFLVVQAQFTASGADTFTLYVDPTLGNLGTGVVKQDSFLGMVNSLSIYSSGAFSLDEIRVGTTLNDVMPAGATITAVPEPASVVLLVFGGLGATGFARVRRRRAGF